MFTTIIILAVIGLAGIVIYLDKILEAITLMFGLVYVAISNSYEYIEKLFN